MALCTPWISGDEVADCCNVETSDAVIFDTVASEASNLLFELSGRQFAGECGPRTVRPGCDQCFCGYQILSRGHVIGPWDYGYPLSFCNSCLIACSPSRIKLAGYPVREITEVKIDGAVVAAAEYNLWNSRYVTRLNDVRWPVAQDLTLDDTEDNTFSITYTYGADPPDLGVSAAAQLACEIYKACTADNCALPSGTVRVSRQGVTVDRLAFTSWAHQSETRTQIGGWRTGLPLVDLFLQTYNPKGLMRRPVFWAPGKRAYAQEFGV